VSKTSNVNDIEMKAKRSFNLAIFSILNRNETAYSQFFEIEEDQTNFIQRFWEQSKNKSAYSKTFKI